MKKLLLLLLSVQCEKTYTEPERNIRYEIAFHEYRGEVQTAATLYYYNDSMELQSFRDSFHNADEVFVTRTDSTIVLSENRYCSLDEEGRITAYISDNESTRFSYTGDILTGLIVYNNGHLVQETQYSGTGSGLLDSTILYTDAGAVATWIKGTITFTDTLCPVSKVHATGLKEFPGTGNYLVRHARYEYYGTEPFPDSVATYRYTYVIYENYTLSEYTDKYDSYGNLSENWHRTWNYVENSGE